MGDDTCPVVYASVCGCNCITYGNDCLRIRARVNKASTGLCLGADCQTAEGCFHDGVYCDRLGNCSATVGQCVAVPKACPDVEQPVCGCDNLTYINDCDRKTERVSLKYEGFCSDDDYVCVFVMEDCVHVCYPFLTRTDKGRLSHRIMKYSTSNNYHTRSTLMNSL